jgi:uncharacterized protein (DUF1800 family)
MVEIIKRELNMKSDRALVAHLMRRAGFGATPAELDSLTAEKAYDEIVDDLVNPDRFEPIDMSHVERYYGGEPVAVHVGKWLYRMANTSRPLEEKMSLFLHHIFPVAWGKSEHGPSLYSEIEMFRNVGLSSFRDILRALSRDPAMIFWLDNNENHKDEINENYGRELLELFSMGVGNYTEDDIKNASRAFTGWTFRQPLSLYPYGHHTADFEFLPDDHDYGEKEFLGEKGNFDGDEIIDIIVKQPATARFISRHLYNFFVEDEVQVPSWETIPPKNPEAIEELVTAYMGSQGNFGVVLKTLFSSRFFKEAADKPKVKSPAELIVGVIRQTGEFSQPKPGIHEFAVTTLNGSPFEGPLAIMGQRLMNPPTVEGWHTGFEWIDSGTLSERVGFVEQQFADPSKPGVSAMLEKAGSLDGDPNQLVNKCLDLLGGINIRDETRASLVKYASNLKNEKSEVGVHNLIQMTAATVDYQFA